MLLDGHRTSVSLEPAFWQSLKDIAARRGDSLNRLVAAVDRERDAAGYGNLSSALRVFVLEDLRSRCERTTQGAAGNSRSST